MLSARGLFGATRPALAAVVPRPKPKGWGEHFARLRDTATRMSPPTRNGRAQPRPSVGKMHQLRLQFEGEAMRVLPATMAAAPDRDLPRALRMLRNVETPSGAGHIASLVAASVTRRRATLPPADLVASLVALAELPPQIVPRRDDLATAWLEGLLARPEAAAELRLDTLVRLLQRLKGPQAMAVPIPHARRYLASVIDVLAARRKEVEAWHVAVVADGVVAFGSTGPEAGELFIDSVELLLRDADLLTGPQLGHVLAAYARVGFHHTALFLRLGQAAGDMGEGLRPDDAARVLGAFEQSRIPHDGLRASLESAMRLKTVHRQQRTSDQ